MLVVPIEPDVAAIGVVEPPRLMTQGLDGAGEVSIGLTPALLSSVEPSGIAPTEATPGAAPAVDPLRVDGAAVVPPAPQDPIDIPEPIVFVFMPAPSNVEPDPLVAVPEMPVPAHGSVLAVGSSGVGLSPPGESSLEPSGIPTGPAADVVPGTPKGDVVPIAGVVGLSGAI